MLKFMLISAQPSRNKFPLSDYFQEQVLIGIKETSSLSVKSDLGPARFNASLDSFLMELIRNLIQKCFFPLLHPVILEYLVWFLNQRMLSKVHYSACNYPIFFLLDAEISHLNKTLSNRLSVFPMHKSAINYFHSLSLPLFALRRL